MSETAYIELPTDRMGNPIRPDDVLLDPSRKVCTVAGYGIGTFSHYVWTVYEDALAPVCQLASSLYHDETVQDVEQDAEEVCSKVKEVLGCTSDIACRQDLKSQMLKFLEDLMTEC